MTLETKRVSNLCALRRSEDEMVSVTKTAEDQILGDKTFVTTGEKMSRRCI